MKDTNLASRYAEALFQVTAEENLAASAQMFQQVSAALEEPSVRSFIFHPRTTLEMKYDLIRALKLGSPLEPFLLLVFSKNRASLLGSIAQEFSRLINEKQNTVIAYIRSAVPLKEESITKIKNHLETITRKTIKTTTIIDPSLWGGFSVEIDGKVMDHSVQNHFKQLKQALISN